MRELNRPGNYAIRTRASEMSPTGSELLDILLRRQREDVGVSGTAGQSLSQDAVAKDPKEAKSVWSAAELNKWASVPMSSRGCTGRCERTVAAQDDEACGMDGTRYRKGSVHGGRRMVNWGQGQRRGRLALVGRR